MSLPKTPSTLLTSVSTAEGKKLKVSASKEETGLPELKEKKTMVDRSKPLPSSLQNEFIPEEVLLSLASAANAGPCPENLLPPKKTKTPKGTLPRPIDQVWHHPVRRTKFKYLIDHPVSLTGAGRDISFLYDVKYVKGETRESSLCPPRLDRSLQSNDGVIVPHKPKKLTDTLIPEEFHIVSNTGVSGLECYDDKYTTLLTDNENRLLLFPSMKPNKRVEVVQLNDVMDAMLERAGVENQEYTGPTKMHKLLHMLKKEQTIYNTVFHELIRQVSVDCADRGELLSKIRTQKLVFDNSTGWNVEKGPQWWAYHSRCKKEIQRSPQHPRQGMQTAQMKEDISSPDKENIFESVIPDFKRWQKMLNEDKEKFTGDCLVSKYDSLKIIKHLQENWTDIGFGIFGRHKSMEGELPPEQQHMKEIVKTIGRLYKEFEIRINGDNGISKILSSLISSLEFCSFKMESVLEFPEMHLKEYEELNEKINEIISQLDASLNIVGTIPPYIDTDSGSVLQAQIFNRIQQWLLKIGNEINNGNIELQHQMDELHISMIQWMVSLLILMVPDFTDQDTLPKLEKESAEKHDVRVAKLELDAIALARKLSQYSSYLNSCCKGMVTAMALNKAGHLEKNPTKDLHELNEMKRECHEWITTCSHLLSGLKGRIIKLLTPEEKEYLFGEEDFVKELIEPETDRLFREDGGESMEDKKLEKEKEEEKEEKPSTSREEERLIRIIEKDENVHTKPLFETDVFFSWRESASQGTLAPKYLEAMAIIERTQEKLIEFESRARQAEEKFEEVNEKLHHTLIRNKELEREVEDILIRSQEREAERRREEENERGGGEEEKEEEEEEEGNKAVESSSKSLKKEAQRKEGLLNPKSRTRTKPTYKTKPKNPVTQSPQPLSAQSLARPTSGHHQSAAMSGRFRTNQQPPSLNTRALLLRTRQLYRVQGSISKGQSYGCCHN
ncbi:axonemal dynein light chain domain-containing protein 1 [Puma concolor]|uniref:Axonemal dynein light chain domain-containing protein 1 n=1 Tax=Puma concolor TaxID=9696 RepID=A0A6P6HP67_PUMCO|nr:axonemal dynein light chain domain-containing protein 1 [Puma concolor]